MGAICYVFLTLCSLNRSSLVCFCVCLFRVFTACCFFVLFFLIFYLYISACLNLMALQTRKTKILIKNAFGLFHTRKGIASRIELRNNTLTQTKKKRIVPQQKQQYRKNDRTRLKADIKVTEFVFCTATERRSSNLHSREACVDPSNIHSEGNESSFHSDLPLAEQNVHYDFHEVSSRLACESEQQKGENSNVAEECTAVLDKCHAESHVDERVDVQKEVFFELVVQNVDVSSCQRRLLASGQEEEQRADADEGSHGIHSGEEPGVKDGESQHEIQRQLFQKRDDHGHRVRIESQKEAIAECAEKKAEAGNAEVQDFRRDGKGLEPGVGVRRDDDSHRGRKCQRQEY